MEFNPPLGSTEEQVCMSETEPKDNLPSFKHFRLL
ncbi:hypothetical protein BVRB_2g024850 isoform B [Beta vulgaris subsp. vulgaris]|nr:hypothetical protein BVRB_2g024850 isoform B [Beta vulgaris subsp. vulgaris]